MVGKKVKLLTNRIYDNGTHRIQWNGEIVNGEPATSGIYICRFLKDGEVSQIKKVIINR